MSPGWDWLPRRAFLFFGVSSFGVVLFVPFTADLIAGRWDDVTLDLTGIDPLIAPRLRIMHAETEIQLGLFPEGYKDGDADFDGGITADDYFLLDRGFLEKRIGLPNGDFNGDRAIDLDDYALIDAGFLSQSVSGGTAVPER